jgi:hypothetical protein
MLRLRRLSPPGWLNLLLFEGSVLFGLLLALSELVGWEFGVAVPFAVATAVKVTDLVLVARAEEPAAGAPVMRPSVAAVRAQQRAGAAGRPSTGARAAADTRAPGPHVPSLAPSLAVRERNRVARGVAAVPVSARLRPRLSRGGAARVVGAWPMPVGSPIEVTGVVVDGAVVEGSAGAANAAWQGPTVGITTDLAWQSKAPRADRARGRNQGRFAARR